MPVYKDEARNTWYYSIYFTDIYGKGKRKVKRGFKTKKAARIAESEMLQNIKPTDSQHKTFEQVFNERLKYSDITRRSYNNRVQQYNKYIKSKFANIRIDKITIEQCKDLRKTLVNDSSIGAEHAKGIFAGFKAVLNYAYKNHYITVNPVISVDPIRYNKPKTTYISRKDFDALVLKMDNLDNKRPILYRQLVQLLFYTGLRVSEALPLTWQDWDPNRQELDINKTIDIMNTEIRHDTAKTKTSLGTVPVPDHICTMLNDMKNQVKPNDVYIFGGKKPITYGTINKAFKAVFREYDENIKIHSLRHSYASHLINNGIDMYVLMKLLRHSNIKETISTYSHLYNDSKRDAMKLFD